MGYNKSTSTFRDIEIATSIINTLVANMAVYIRINACSNAATTITINCVVLEFDSASIKSKQSGEITISSATATATITAVTTTKALLAYCGETTASETLWYAFNALGKLALTNSTTITASRGGSVEGSLVVAWNLIEFN